MLNTKKLLTKILSKLTDSGVKTTITYVNYRKKNGIVFVDCYIPGSMTVNTNYQVLGTLPTGYRPSGTFYGNAGTNSANAGVFYIANDGKIGVKVFSGTTTYFWFQTAFAITD